MVNGAGLAMTTMDLVKRAGGEPANFLDIGGGARADKVAAAMRLILADPKVNAILVNIFGGITRGDEVARGLIEARAQQERDVPMVVRIVGTNAAEAAVLLEEAQFVTAATLDEAAAQAVAAVEGRARHEHPDRRATAGVVVQGMTGREGEFHGAAMLEYGTQVVAGHDARQGRPDRARRARPGVRHGRRRGPRDRRQHVVHLRPGGRRAGRGHGGRRGRDQDDLLHHRGHPGARHDPGRRRWSRPPAPG